MNRQSLISEMEQQAQVILAQLKVVRNYPLGDRRRARLERLEGQLIGWYKAMAVAKNWSNQVNFSVDAERQAFAQLVTEHKPGHPIALMIGDVLRLQQS